MKIKIGKKVKPEIHKKVYKFVIEFMEGDADGEDFQDVFVPEDYPQMERWLTFLDNCKKAYPHGRGGDDDYNSEIVPDYWYFVESYEDDVTEEQELEIEKRKFYIDWPSDPHYGIQDSFQDYVVTYFDENGIEYECKIVK